MGSSGSLVNIGQAIFDPAGWAIDKVHQNVVKDLNLPGMNIVNWLQDFYQAPVVNTAKYITGEDAFATHQNWGGGKDSWITETMRGTTEGSYYKDWDAYNEQQRQQQAAAKQRLADENRLKSEKKRQGVGVAGHTSTLTDDEYSYAKGIL